MRERNSGSMGINNNAILLAYGFWPVALQPRLIGIQPIDDPVGYPESPGSILRV